LHSTHLILAVDDDVRKQTLSLASPQFQTQTATLSGKHESSAQLANNQFTQSTPERLTAAEVAAYVKGQTRTVLLWTRQGKLKGYSLSGTKRRVWRYLQSDVDSLLLSNPVISAPAPFVLSEGKAQ